MTCFGADRSRGAWPLSDPSSTETCKTVRGTQRPLCAQERCCPSSSGRATARACGCVPRVEQGREAIPPEEARLSPTGNDRRKFPRRSNDALLLRVVFVLGDRLSPREVQHCRVRDAARQRGRRRPLPSFLASFLPSFQRRRRALRRRPLLGVAVGRCAERRSPRRPAGRPAAPWALANCRADVFEEVSDALCSAVSGTSRATPQPAVAEPAHPTHVPPAETRQRHALRPRADVVGASPSIPVADAGGVRPFSPGADVAGATQVPAQMWLGRAHPRCRCAPSVRRRRGKGVGA